MSLVFCDSFDHYTGIAYKYQQSSGGGGYPWYGDWGIRGAAGRNGTNALYLGGSSNSGNAWGPPWVQRDFPVTYGTLFAGVAWKYQSDRQGVMLMMLDSAGGRCMELRTAGSWQLQIVRSGNTQLGSLSTIPWTVTNWNFLELGVKFSATAGWVEARINGTLACSYYGTGTDRATANGNTSSGNAGNAQHVRLTDPDGAQNGVSLAYWFDDFYVCDSSGPVANDFLGDIRVMAVMPNADGSRIDWQRFGTASTANYQQVDESDPNGDTDAVRQNAVGSIDLYKFPALPANIAQVLGVAHNLTARTDAAGSRSVRPHVKLASGETDAGVDHALGQSYTMYQDAMSVRPTDGAAFEPADFTSGEFGQKVSA